MSSCYQPIVGIDFSGAKDPRKKIWIAIASFDGMTLAIKRLDRLDHLIEPSETPFKALCNRLTALSHPLIGLDFPFALPGALISNPSWVDWLREMPRRYGSADAFRLACRAMTGGQEPRRQAEIDAAAPMSSFNLRLYKQTYHGLADVIAPLVAAGVFRAYPMMAFDPKFGGLVEICPASVLQAWWGPGGNAGYKGPSAKNRDCRQTIMAQLANHGVRVPNHLRDCVTEDRGGDAVDALLAAYATWRVALAPQRLLPRPGTHDLIEGRIYFES